LYHRLHVQVKICNELVDTSISLRRHQKQENGAKLRNDIGSWYNRTLKKRETRSYSLLLSDMEELVMLLHGIFVSTSHILKLHKTPGVNWRRASSRVCLTRNGGNIVLEH